MKNKFVLLGILAALFALSLPLYADPGGPAVQTVVSTADSIAADVAMVEAQAVVIAADSFAVKNALGTVAGFAVLILGSLLLAVAFMPFLFGLKRTAARYAESDLAKRTKSHVLKHQLSA